MEACTRDLGMTAGCTDWATRLTLMDATARTSGLKSKPTVIIACLTEAWSLRDTVYETLVTKIILRGKTT
jgi:hypothetical protein